MTVGLARISGDAVTLLDSPTLDSPTDAVSLADVESLYDRGRMLDAYRLGVDRLGPPRRWPGAAGRVLAGRVAMNVGGPRLARVLHGLAHREHPADDAAAYYCGRAVLDRRGPLAALAYCRDRGDLPAADPAVRADWLAFRASLAATYRDFEAAFDLLDEADRLAPDRPWLQIERAHVLHGADRYDEAVAAARRSLDLRPWFRPGVQSLAHLMQVRDQDDQALALLVEATGHLQTAAVLFQLAALQDHLRLHADALATLARVDDLIPLRERSYDRSLAGLRSNVAYHAGDLPGAIAAAERAGPDDEFFTKLAAKLREQLAAGPLRPRVSLRLPFVRQHHMTCAPATLTAISRYWGRPADHLGVVDAICYDGTPGYSQRTWAESAGWVTRDFRVTWDAAVALVDRGVPFTLATTQVGNAHLQAVVGYDPTRGTLLCRDPFQYYEAEYSAEMLLAYNAPFGPPGMVMLPPAEAHRLDGVDLPDADLLDRMHAVERSLAAHDRPAAAAARAEVHALAPGHRVGFQADRAIAAYDADPAATLAAFDGLLALHPDSPPVQLYRVYALRRLDRRDLVLQQLADACRDRRRADPVFLHLYAEARREEEGDTAAVAGLLRDALRRRPTHAASLATLGHVRWGRGDHADATVLYHLAACVDDTNEQASQTHFTAARHLGQVDRAVAMLERRFARLGKRSGRPACTLAWAYEQLDRVAEALDALDRGLAVRPDDGDLLLYAADVRGRRADLPRAKSLLAAATGRAKENARLRSAARIATYDGDQPAALGLWRQVLAAEPMAVDAHRAVTQLVAETESVAAAVEHLRAACDRFPDNVDLQQHRIMWLREVGAEAVAAASAELVARRPGNVWARVELSLALGRTGRAAEAVAQAEAAVAVNANSPNAHFAAGRGLAQMDRLDEARGHFRRAVELSVNYVAALEALADAYPDEAGRREAVAFIGGQVSGQAHFGDGLLAFARMAVRTLPADEVEAALRRAHAARPDLWTTSAALVRFHRDANALDAALAAATAAVDRFPLLAQLWLDLAHVHRLRGERDGQIAALGRCLELAPAWSAAARQLAQAQQLAGDVAAAVATMERVVARDPLEAVNHEALADLLWAAKREAEAVARARQAVLLDPHREGAWSSLRGFAKRSGKADDVVELARDVCRRRGGEAASWLVLARALSGQATLAERLEVVDRAVALAPTNANAHDHRAMLLVEAGRHDDAVAACDPPAFHGRPPVELRGRAAWILDQRKDRPAAVAAMADVLGDNPGYHWGWQQLIRWRAEAKDPPAYLRAATDMTARFPHDALARNNLAHAQLAVGDRAAAKATLARSLAIVPDDRYVLNKLFDVQLEDGELDAAGATLAVLARHQSEEAAAGATVELAAARRDAVGAGAALLRLCRVKEPANKTGLAEAIAAMDKATLGTAVDAALAAAAADAGVRPAVVERWVGRLAKAKRWADCRAAAVRFEVGSPVWVAATVAYVGGLGEAGRARPVVAVSRGRSAAAVRGNGRLWGTVVTALLKANAPARSARWGHDWKGRTDAKPWMLVNLATALRRVGRDAEAGDVGRHAMAMPADATTPKLVAWLAADEVVAGRRGPNVDRLLAGDTAKLEKQYAYLLAVVRAVAPVCGTPPDAAAARAARRGLDAAFVRVKTDRRQSELKRLFRRAAWRVARSRPSVAAWAWAAAHEVSTRVVWR